MSGTGLVVAVPAAVLGAASFGLASAAQQRATKQVAQRTTLSPRLLLDLWHRPLWLLGLVMTVLALLLQILALAFGPLTVVQPLLVTGVVFTGVFAAVLARRRPDRPIVLGGLACAAGLSTFLLLARPVPGPGSPNSAAGPDGPDLDGVGSGTGLLLAVVLAAVVLVCLVYAAVTAHPSRILVLALATGVLYGVTAALMKALTAQLHHGLTTPLIHPTLYLACLVGPMGFLLSQNTFQQGRLISPAIAVITSVDPIVGVFAGLGWLGEDLDASPGRLAGETVAAVVVLTGIAAITLRGTRLLHRHDEPTSAPPLSATHDDQPSRAGSWS